MRSGLAGPIPMPKRHASAVWQGDLKAGKGRVSTESGAIKDTAYSFTTRFENERGTNPEELIAAAHASCFSMAFANELTKVGLKPETVETTASATFEKTDAGFTVTGIHLESRAKVPEADNAKFQQAAEAAKKGCPISRLLAPGTNITLRATLA